MPKWAILAAAGAGLALAVVAALRSWPVINVVETGRTPEYPDLRPKPYHARKDRVFEAAVRAVEQMPRWTLASFERERGEIRAEAGTRLFRFVDDVVIRVTEEGGATIVHVRSASRVGRGDFGQNARNVRAFFEGLDRQMESAFGREAGAG